MKPSRIDTTLAPLEFILSVATALMVLALLLVVPATVLGSGSFLGIGDSSVCVVVPQGGAGPVAERGGANSVHVVGLKPGISSVENQVRLCDFTPSTTQKLWSTVSELPDLCYSLGFLTLAWLLTRAARRRGLFSPQVALGIGRLGLFVLLGSVAMGALRWWAQWQVVSSMADRSGPGRLVGAFHLHWSTFFIGFGLLTLGRVMSQSVRMQREIDTTV
jgi:hypothetical protein